MTVAKHVFFLGLGGIGMSALARHLNSLGHVAVSYTHLTLPTKA